MLRLVAAAAFRRTQPVLAPAVLRTAVMPVAPVRWAATVQQFLDRAEVTDRVISVLKNYDRITDVSKVSPTAHFVKDLGLDSLDAVEVVLALEDEFVITFPDAEAEKILTVEDAVNFIVAHPKAK